jgi:formate C-acetyltransferase
MPKFGNDIPWVDELARKVVDIFCDEVSHVNSPEYLYTLFPAISTDRGFTTMGQGVGATPDGRGAGDPVSENQLHPGHRLQRLFRTNGQTGPG